MWLHENNLKVWMGDTILEFKLQNDEFLTHSEQSAFSKVA